MLDTKQSWDDLVRRHAPDAATREAILGNPLYQNITGKFVAAHDYIAAERLHELDAERTLGPDRGRHPAQPPCARLPRGAGPHGGVLRQPAAALAHRSLPLHGCSRWPPSRSSPWPTASSAPSSWPTSPSSSSSSRRWRRASSSRARAVDRTLRDAGHHVPGGDHAGGRAGPGSRDVRRPAAAAGLLAGRPGGQPHRAPVRARARSDRRRGRARRRGRRAGPRPGRRAGPGAAADHRRGPAAAGGGRPASGTCGWRPSARRDVARRLEPLAPRWARATDGRPGRHRPRRAAGPGRPARGRSGRPSPTACRTP